MKRDYTTGVTDTVPDFFVGVEVEKTPMHGQKTLFVVGPQSAKTIRHLAAIHKINHIYLGANMSFNGDVDLWDNIIMDLLNADLWVTLDYSVAYHETVLELGFNERDRFISMISIKLPYINQLNYNACIKLDDKDFRATNTGVWVHRVHDLQDKAVYTDWSHYTKDEML